MRSEKTNRALILWLADYRLREKKATSRHPDANAAKVFPGMTPEELKQVTTSDLSLDPLTAEAERLSRAALLEVDDDEVCQLARQCQTLPFPSTTEEYRNEQPLLEAWEKAHAKLLEIALKAKQQSKI